MQLAERAFGIGMPDKNGEEERAITSPSTQKKNHFFFALAWDGKI